MSWIGVGIGAGAGVLKAELVDQPKANKQLALAAATQKYAPWTGLSAQPVTQADPLGSAIQGGATGASLSQGASTASAMQGLALAQTQLAQAKTNQMNLNGAAPIPTAPLPDGDGNSPMPVAAPPAAPSPTPQAQNQIIPPQAPTLGGPQGQATAAAQPWWGSIPAPAPGQIPAPAPGQTQAPGPNTPPGASQGPQGMSRRQRQKPLTPWTNQY